MELKNYRSARGLVKLFGLMFRSKNFINKPLLFDFGFDSKMHSSIHMWFVFYPIDVYFLDENKKIVDLKRNISPFEIFISNNASRYIIETKIGYFSNLKINDEIKF